eukprot:COSAG06_NODE_1451_length_9435_cov_11.764353_8_plen_83_part_00
MTATVWSRESAVCSRLPSACVRGGGGGCFLSVEMYPTALAGLIWPALLFTPPLMYTVCAPLVIPSHPITACSIRCGAFPIHP